MGALKFLKRSKIFSANTAKMGTPKNAPIFLIKKQKID